MLNFCSRRFYDDGELSEFRVRKQGAKPLQADLPFTYVPVPVNAAAEGVKGVVGVKQLEPVPSDSPLNRPRQFINAFWCPNFIACDEQVACIKANPNPLLGQALNNFSQLLQSVAEASALPCSVFQSAK
jgi:hypothetical protein